MPSGDFNRLRVFLILALVIAGGAITLLPHWLRIGKHSLAPVFLQGKGKKFSLDLIPPESISIADRLRLVADPELGMDIVALGLVETLSVDSTGFVRVVLGVTTPFCPYTREIAQAVLDTLLSTPGVSQGVVKLDPQLIRYRGQKPK